MNKLILILLAFIGTLSACTSEKQKFVDDLDSSWRINQMVLDRYAPLPDTTIIPTSNSIITFFSCAMGNGYCDGAYNINGTEDQEFMFNAVVVDDDKSVGIESIEQNPSYRFGGVFLVTTLTPTNLVMEAEGDGSFVGLNIPYNKITFYCEHY
jgi:hypothetical protein